MSKRVPLHLEKDGWVPAKRPPDMPTTHQREVDDAFSMGLLLGYCLGATGVTIFIGVVIVVFL